MPIAVPRPARTTAGVQSGRLLRKALPALLLLSALFFSATPAYAINVTTVADDGVTTAQITAALQGAGVTISNLTIVNNGANCANRGRAIGLFSQGTTPTGPGPVLGDASGIVLATGPMKIAGDFLVSPNSDPRWDNTLCTANTSDADMVTLEPQTANGEYIAIEFDIVPQYSTMAIPFQFGSDEFPEYVCTAYNDITGIFVSGPGINGPYSNNAENYAKTAAGDLTSINWVNTGQVGSQGSLAQCGSLSNTDYYTDNSSGDLAGGNATVATTNTNLELDGWTNYIYQPITVTPGQTYHVKAVIADAGDRQWDSAVFFHLIFSTDALLGFDFGDAPDSYRTRTSSGGPRHAIRSTIYLGPNLPDNEVTGQPTVAADGDDSAGTDDEDGIASFPTLSASATGYAVNVTATNTSGSTATLVGWIDFNRNGTFEAAEGVSTTVATGTTGGTATLTWSSLPGLVAGTTYARLRFTTDGAVTTATPGGTAGDGEVEDYSLAIVEANLSTSTKSWVDLNGGDQEPGDVIRYTITLDNNTGGGDATNVSVDDTIDASFDLASFSLVSPSGASHTYDSGTGALSVTGLDVPAGGSLAVVFDVTIPAGTAAGTIINNSATITVPGGTGANPDAPVLTVSGGSVPGTGTKLLYLYDNTATPARKLSRTTTNSSNSVTINRGASQNWTMDPAAVGDITIDPSVGATVPVNLILRRGTLNNTNGNHSITVNLQCSSGGTTLTDTRTYNLTNTIIAAAFTLTTTPAPWSTPITCAAGDRWVLTVIHNTVGSVNNNMRVYFYNTTVTPQRSQVGLPATTVINVDSIAYYDAPYPLGNLVTSVEPGDTVYVRATVSDPFGSYDINVGDTAASRPDITITDSSGTTALAATDMTELGALTDNPPGTKTFEYSAGYTIPDGGPTGNWTVRVEAVEGTEDTVRDYGVAALPVVVPAPSLTFLKFSQVERDPVNDITNPQAIPGADVLYTLQISNSGPGTVDSGMAISDPIPANTKLYVGDLGDGSPVLFSDPDSDSGFTPPQPFTLGYFSDAACSSSATPSADPDEFDANIRCLVITMTGTMSGASGAVTPDFSLIIRTRIQ